MARDMTEITSCRLQVDGEARRGWLVLGAGPALWLLRLRYKKLTRAGRLQLSTVEKQAVIETSHSGNISDICLQSASNILLSAAEDCKVKIWSFKVTFYFNILTPYSIYSNNFLKSSPIGSQI